MISTGPAIQRAARRCLLLAAALAIALLGCGDKPSPLAKLTEAAGPVERAVGTAAWQPAKIGTGYFVGDAARTADGNAKLAIGTATLAMDPHTIVRFGGKRGERASLSVELGAFELIGAGQFGVGLGEISIADGGGVRVVAGADGATSLELRLGEASFVGADGKTLSLTLGQIIDVSLGDVVMVPLPTTPDARPIDAAPPPPTVALALAITGGKAQLRPTPDGAWAATPAGPAELTAGGALKLGKGTSATATGTGLELTLSAGAELAAGGEPFAAVRAGKASASLTEGGPARLAVPGATVGRSGTAPAAATVDVTSKITTLTATRGALEVIGAAGKMTLQRGEAVTIGRDGTIDMIYDVPDYYDLQIDAGESFTVHDPKGATAIRIAWGDRCGGDGDVEIARGGDFAGARRSGGATAANVMVASGSWRYRVKCDDGKTAASGSISVRRDDGRRPLPAKPGTNPVDADGRDYRVVYQNLVPSIEFRWRNATGNGFRLHLGTGKKARVLTSASPKVLVPGKDLDDGTYPFYFERASGGAPSKTSRLIIEFDNAAPAASIDLPRNGEAFGGAVTIKGVALPGWSASVDGKDLEVDRQGRFGASVAPPSGAAALAILLSNPQRGKHYYLRRQR